jgi:hypothetical protein
MITILSLQEYKSPSHILPQEYLLSQLWPGRKVQSVSNI